MVSLIMAAAAIGAAFYFLSIISEDYFVPAIDKLTQRLGLSSDAAGATLLAMGSSAPEFFTSLFAVFGAGDTADIGAGAIVGSAIFNVLVIVGASSMYKAVTLQWQPIIRDMVFYILSILMLLYAFSDGFIALAEAALFVGVYAVYVFMTVNWRKWLKYDDETSAVELLEDNKVGVLGQKVRFLLDRLLVNPRQKPHLYYVTFTLSILAIAGLSHQLVASVEIIAHQLDINATFLALTVLAAGTSVPDLIGSVVVARQGRGDMAVSNAIGSNIFDILFGLGLPWLAFIVLKGGTVPVSSENLTSSIILLLATVVALLFIVITRNWKISHRSGFLLLGLYGAYIVYIITQVT